ncbi:hypothetical protein GGX14DRAFT_459647, partial [Mycena pura]
MHFVTVSFAALSGDSNFPYHSKDDTDSDYFLDDPEDDTDMDCQCSLDDPEDDADSDFSLSACFFDDPEDDTDSDCSLSARFLDDPEDGADSDRSLDGPDDSFPVRSVAEWGQLIRCPLLCRIVQAYILTSQWEWVDLYILLDISWDELRATICTLRPFTGYNPRKIVALFGSMGRHLLSDASSRAMSLELARGSIRLLNDIRTGQQPSRLWPRYNPWGLYVRTSPYSLELLQDIRDFVPFKSDEYHVPNAFKPETYHDVLQWLKAFPNPPQDVIETWQNHLMAACDNRQWLNKHDPDQRWKWQNDLQLKGLFL